MTAQEVKGIKEKYTPGVRIRLIRMEDPFSMLSEGDEGIVTFVDDIGQIHMHWANHSALALVPEVDEFEIIG